MRKFFKYAGAVLLAVCFGLVTTHLWNSRSPDVNTPAAEALRVASHNVHYILLDQSEGAWSVEGWMARRDALDAAFKDIGADIIAFQEMESFRRGDGSVNLARDYLLKRNPEYAAAATGDWRKFPSTQPIFYRKDHYAVIDQGWFFFSETPDQIYSRTFNGSYPAFASWVLFGDKRNRSQFRVVNLHLDFRSGENRLRSATLIEQRMRPWIQAVEKIFVMGDLNALAGSRTARILRDADLEIMDMPGSSFHFNYGLNLFGAIDHILYTPGIRPIAKPMVLRKKYGGIYPSDHYPVIGDFVLQ